MSFLRGGSSNCLQTWYLGSHGAVSFNSKRSATHGPEHGTGKSGTLGRIRLESLFVELFDCGKADPEESKVPSSDVARSGERSRRDR